MDPKLVGIKEEQTKTRAELIAESVITMFANCSDRRTYLTRKQHKFTWKLIAWKKLFSVTNKKCGIVGWGEVSKQVALYLARMGLAVRVYDPHVEDAELKGNGLIKALSLKEIFLESDYISITEDSLGTELKEIDTGELLSVMKEDTSLVLACDYAIDEETLFKYLFNKSAVIGIIKTGEDQTYGSKIIELDNVIATRVLE